MRFTGLARGNNALPVLSSTPCRSSAACLAELHLERRRTGPSTQKMPGRRRPEAQLRVRKSEGRELQFSAVRVYLGDVGK